MAELVDAPDLKSVEHCACEGSSPSRPIDTIQCQNLIKTFLTTQYIMNIEFSTSSMLQSPVIVDTDAGTATLTYKKSGKDYTYQAPDPSTFAADLKSCIASDASVGSFISQAFKQGRLVEVTV